MLQTYVYSCIEIDAEGRSILVPNLSAVRIGLPEMYTPIPLALLTVVEMGGRRYKGVDNGGAR